MELEKQVYEQIIKRLDIDDESLEEFTYDTVIFNMGDDRPNLGLDSIDVLELVTLIYENWQINVPAEDMRKLYSVYTIAEYIRNFKKDE